MRFHVFSEGLTDDDRRSLAELARRLGYTVPLDFREPDLIPIASRFQGYRSSFSPYLRLLFPDILSELDWVIWSDCDTLWFRDPAELWKMRESNVSLFWAQDCQASGVALFAQRHPELDAERYANSGILLMNLKLLREKRLFERCLDFERRWGTTAYPDQDMLNYLCNEDSRLIDASWGCLRPSREAAHGVVVHCIGIGPQFNAPYAHWHPAYEMWFRAYAWLSEGRDVRVCPVWQSVLFAVLGVVYPPAWLAWLVSLPFRRFMQPHNVRRVMFLCWLRRRTAFG